MQEATAAAATHLAEQLVPEAAEVLASEAKAAQPGPTQLKAAEPEATFVGAFVDGANSGINSLLDKLSPVGEANHASHAAGAVDHGLCMHPQVTSIAGCMHVHPHDCVYPEADYGFTHTDGDLSLHLRAIARGFMAAVLLEWSFSKAAARCMGSFSLV